MDDTEYYRIDRMKREEDRGKTREEDGPSPLEGAEETHTLLRDKAASGDALRDTFAAAALTGLLAGPHDWREAKMYDTVEESSAKFAYSLADAMLEARSLGKPSNQSVSPSGETARKNNK